jgi:HEAT repeat protein
VPQSATSYAPSPEETERIGRIDAAATAGASAVPFLLEALREPSWLVRRHAIATLAALGDVAVQPLCKVLATQRGDETLLAAAVDALGASSGNATEGVLALIEHPDPAVVVDAVMVLGRRRSQRAVPQLVELAQHDNDNVAVGAIEALGRIGGHSAVDALVRAIKSRQFFRAFPAIDVLGRTGDPRAVPALAPLLGDPLYGLEAARALGHTGDKAAVSPLATSLCAGGDAAARVAAMALVELVDRHRSRYGRDGVVEEEIRRLAPPGAERRLAQALNEATPAEAAAISFVLGTIGRSAALPALVAQLDGPEPAASAAARALQKLGSAADEEVVRGLRDGDSSRRLVLLHSLSGAFATANEVVGCLRDPDPRVRAAACELLARMGNPAAVPALFGVLEDPNPAVLHAAIGAIQSLGNPRTERLTQQALASSNRQVRRAGLRIAGYFGYSSCLEPIDEIMRGNDAQLRETAVEALALIEEPQAMELITRAARSEQPGMRAAAMRAMALRGNDPRGVSFLMRGLRDPEAWVRYYACRSLGRLGTSAAADAIAELVSDDAGQVRVAAIEALSHLGTPGALNAVLAAADGDDPDLRRAALLGLGIARWLEASPLLIRATRDPDSATRLVAISALADFQVPEAVDALSAAARDEDEAVRNAAVGFLASRRTVDASRALIALLDHPQIREQAMGALSVPSAGRVAAIQEALLKAGDELAQLLVSALARMKAPLAEEAIIAATAFTNVPARRAACSALGSLGSPEAVEALERLADRDPDDSVRQTCQIALGR